MAELWAADARKLSPVFIRSTASAALAMHGRGSVNTSFRSHDESMDTSLPFERDDVYCKSLHDNVGAPVGIVWESNATVFQIHIPKPSSRNNVMIQYPYTP